MLYSYVIHFYEKRLNICFLFSKGLSASFAIKADYIVENTKTKEKSLFVDIISDRDDFDKYLDTDYIKYDKSIVDERLKITYKSNPENNTKYILTDVGYVNIQENNIENVNTSMTQ